MKITKKILEKIIKEETAKILSERGTIGDYPEAPPPRAIPGHGSLIRNTALEASKFAEWMEGYGDLSPDQKKEFIKMAVVFLGTIGFEAAGGTMAALSAAGLLTVSLVVGLLVGLGIAFIEFKGWMDSGTAWAPGGIPGAHPSRGGGKKGAKLRQKLMPSTYDPTHFAPGEEES